MSETNGIIRIPGTHSVADTVEKLKAILQARGVTIFAIVDHSGEAAQAGMHMPNTKLLIFGSPKAGTPVMLASPSIALDLPLKILVAEDETGKASLSYNIAQFLTERHRVPPELAKALAAVEGIAAEAAAQ
jgi:uncharacterized protein (DUF302 family)